MTLTSYNAFLQNLPLVFSRQYINYKSLIARAIEQKQKIGPWAPEKYNWVKKRSAIFIYFDVKNPCND